ncbi:MULTISPECIES: DUF2306 domain-containing protein [unclassified Microbacterium]|uniref:DUF2306 domain-containing protein n=1 Tax=unclassified Microbacterium TaxID=2609290 RepID=UPI000EAA098D|nr:MULTISPECIES: DUF2306 domain-containing protein [unclassified Microbacterium]MBT2484435.1 DUF2306 domain-containing protein [Microbacterium sp. ISL-108]RKN69505.1 DUF2306 domain-containing protein [Microbacterium sp. CGR2]
MHTTRPAHRGEWLIAAGLIALALIPSLAGGVRLGELASGAAETAQNARFVRMPLPVVLHIIGALVFSFVGAFQFLPGLRRRHIGWHRFAGRYLLVPSGLIVAGTGLWMTAFYDVPPVDGVALQLSRYVVGILMVAFIVLGLTAILRLDVASHRAWMIRGYALALGAGTQVLTSAPFLIAFGAPDEFWRLVQMDAGWVLNMVVAEVVIRRQRVVRSVRRPRPVAVGG